MRRHLLSASLLPLIACAVLAGCSTSGQPALMIDPQADAALQNMSQSLAAAHSISFRSNATMDEPLESGQMSSFSRVSKVVMSRPDKLFVESDRGNKTWLFWHRGTQLTVLDKATNRYATLAVPAPVDKMLDFVADKYGLVLPLTDFLFPDPYKVLTADAQKCTFVGMRRLGSTRCEHLLFTQEDMDWQLWIEGGNPPVLRKIVMDYKTRPGRPQFMAVVSEWNLAAPAEDRLFDPQLPKDAKKVDMSVLVGDVQGE